MGSNSDGSEYFSATSGDEYADCSDTSVDVSDVEKSVADEPPGKPLKPAFLRSLAEKSEEDYPALSSAAAASFSRPITAPVQSVVPIRQRRLNIERTVATTTTTTTTTTNRVVIPVAVLAAPSSALAHPQSYRRRPAPRQDRLPPKLVESKVAPISLTKEDKALMKERKRLLGNGQKSVRASFNVVVTILNKITACQEQLEQEDAGTQQKLQRYMADVQGALDKVTDANGIVREAARETVGMKPENYDSCRNELRDFTIKAAKAAEEARLAETAAEQAFAFAKEEIKKMQAAKQQAEIDRGEIRKRAKKPEASSASASSSRARVHQPITEKKPGKIKQAFNRMGNFIYQHPVFTIISALIMLIMTAYLFRESFQRKNQRGHDAQATTPSTSLDILNGLSTAGAAAGARVVNGVRRWAQGPAQPEVVGEQGTLLLMSNLLVTKKEDASEVIIQVRVINYEPYYAQVALLRMFHHIDERFKDDVKEMLKDLPLIMFDRMKEGESQAMTAVFGAGNVEGLYMRVAEQPNDSQLAELAELMVDFARNAGMRIVMTVRARAAFHALQEQRENGYSADTEESDSSLRMR